jgi:hypothetical protein
LAERRFPPPRAVEDIGAAFVVKNGSGQKLLYVSRPFVAASYFGQSLQIGVSKAQG